MEVAIVFLVEPGVARDNQTESLGELEVPVDLRLKKEEKRGTQVEDLVSILICDDDSNKTVNVDSNLSKHHREQPVNFLKEN